MRLALLILVLFAWILHQRIVGADRCEFLGYHDAHWITPTVRTCTRCPMTWRRDPGDIAATTTNQPGGW